MGKRSVLLDKIGRMLINAKLKVIDSAEKHAKRRGKDKEAQKRAQQRYKTEVQKKNRKLD